MKVSKIIERAEKDDSLPRFDRKSAISFINDALFDIAKKSSNQLSEIIDEYSQGRYVFKERPIKISNVKVGSEEKGFISIIKDSHERVDSFEERF